MFICPIITLHEQRKRQNLESIFSFITIDGIMPLYLIVHIIAWYLQQTNDKEKQKIKVLFCFNNSRKNQWNYSGKEGGYCIGVIFPNYLYPKQNIPNKV